jgi:A/G-specific adenine glycosylase
MAMSDLHATAGLVRRPRARAALARRGGDALVGDGLGVHAAADAGRPGRAGATGSGWSLADPAALAAAPSGEAVRAWGRLGYPRRALRLHAAATAIVERHGGEVPSAYDDLRALPGVGDYTAPRHRDLRRSAAARRARHQRPAGAGAALSGRRAAAGRPRPPRSALADELLPEDEADAAHLVDRRDGARRAGVHGGPTALRACPVAELCAWRAAGYPAYDGPPRKAQTWAVPTASAGAPARPWSAMPRARCPLRASTAPGTTPPARPLPRSLLDDGLLVLDPDGTRCRIVRPKLVQPKHSYGTTAISGPATRGPRIF